MGRYEDPYRGDDGRDGLVRDHRLRWSAAIILLSLIAMAGWTGVVVLLSSASRDVVVVLVQPTNAPGPTPTPPASPQPEASDDCRQASTEPVACPHAATPEPAHAPGSPASLPARELFAEVEFLPGAFHYVSADGRTSTAIEVTLTDARRQPVPRHLVHLVTDSGSCPIAPCPDAGPGVVVKAGTEETDQARTDASGRARFTLYGTRPGAVLVHVDDRDPTTTIPPGPPLAIEFTRKVVVLAMGMNSMRDKRFCYWGTGTQGLSMLGAVDCESRFADVVSKDTTIIGSLAGLGYFHEKDHRNLGLPSVLDAAWASVPCPGQPRVHCMATVVATTEGVRWEAPSFDIRLLNNIPKQLFIDSWATNLVRTMQAYDDVLHRTQHVHASFYLVGHSMGGQLVVRALRAANTLQFTRPATRGQLPVVLAVDGSLNWRAVGWPPVRVGHIPDRKAGCGFVFAVPYSATRRAENIRELERAHERAGTRLIAITNEKDRIVEERVATLGATSLSSDAYIEKVFTRDGSDPGCAHSSLLWFEAGKLVEDRETQVTDAFPIATLLRDYIGPAIASPRPR